MRVGCDQSILNESKLKKLGADKKEKKDKYNTITDFLKVIGSFPEIIQLSQFFGRRS